LDSKIETYLTLIARDLLTNLASQQAQHSTKVYSLYCYTLTTKLWKH